MSNTSTRESGLRLPRQYRQEFWLWAALIVFVALVALSTWLSPPKQRTEEFYPNRSTYNNLGSGYKAWALAAKKSGLTLNLWKQPFANLSQLKGHNTMVLIHPLTLSEKEVTFGPKEAQQLVAWVSKGNTAILLDDFQSYGSKSLAKHLHLKLKALPKTKNSGAAPSKTLFLSNDIPAPLKAHLRQPIQSDTAFGFITENPLAQPLLETKAHQPVLIMRRYGEGMLILGTLSDLAENTWLHRPASIQNYQLLLNLIASPKQPIWINEYVHGQKNSGSLMAFYQQKTPLGKGLNQLLLYFLMLAWIGFTPWRQIATDKRSYSTSPDTIDSEATSQAYIQAMANLYQQHQAQSLPLRLQIQRLEKTLKRYHGIELTEESQVENLIRQCFTAYSEEALAPDQLLKTLSQVRAYLQAPNTKLNTKTFLNYAQALTQLEIICKPRNHLQTGNHF